MEFEINSSFIPFEWMSAPAHPLGNNLEQPLPDPRNASIAEIQEAQRRNQIPGLVRRWIPVDAILSWEYWWCVPGRLLLPEDVELLQKDLSRVESILSRLLWLLGGYCFNQETSWEGHKHPCHDWQQVLDFVKAQGLNSYVLDIDFFPMAIQLENEQTSANHHPVPHIAVEPAHWHIEFFQLRPVAGGFEIEEAKTPCSCQIWTGQPFIKYLETDQVIPRYDLWLSKPLNLTLPNWLP